MWEKKTWGRRLKHSENALQVRLIMFNVETKKQAVAFLQIQLTGQN